MSESSTEREAAALFGRAIRAQDKRYPLIKLTDEELCALDGGPGNPTGTPYPWLDDHGSEQRQLGCDVASRELAIRGLVDGDQPAGGQRPANKSLRATLHVRRTAGFTVTAERRSATDRRFRVLYLHSVGALEDDVTHDGLHTFSMATRELALTRLTSFVDPDGNAVDNPRAKRRVLPYERIANGISGGELSVAQFVTAIHRTCPAGDRRITIYTLLNRVLVTEPAMSAQDTPGVSIEEAGPAQLARRIRDFASI